ncbi:AAA family ATPase [Rhodanobacter hydrolyticus]|uniref:AAA family ATPase n=1 Tax=Rhodanobacter hydrolyticus TaxID=2250595 RepID=A0ABW8J1J6_9GAMM
MIRSIQRLRHFGVFDDFRKTAALSDFGSKNIIYGWNYSGKTTLSRLFAALGQGKPYPECPSATFEVQTSSGQSVTETMLSTSNLKVEVFNSDFVATNLSWTGEDFQSILLLGDESIEAEKAIEHWSKRLNECRGRWANTRTKISDIDGRISSAKTAAAKAIKTTLQIVEAFTATHLGSEITRLPADRQQAVLSDEAYAADMKLAMTSEQEQLSAVPSISAPTLSLQTLLQGAMPLLQYLPAISATLDYLRAHADVARWVEQGLSLHEDAAACEFCGGLLTEERLAQLRGHFSKDLAQHKVSLNALHARVKTAQIATEWLTPTAFAPQFQAEASTLNSRLKHLCEVYNDDLVKLMAALQTKVDDPFVDQLAPMVFPDISPVLENTFTQAKNLILRNNKSIGNFGQEKKSAIGRLKAHFAAKFALDQTQAKENKDRERAERYQGRLKALGGGMAQQIKDLQAKIDRAQKGRERLNERIGGLLGTGIIQIEVVQVNETDRFTLRRQGQPARNLSDGERTAIAFAFFLTKLEEHKSLDDVIVYIDDPISSLDSNHVFQVYSIIESMFFKQEQVGGRWITSCRQLFLSTHNFEFFEMLKRLPIKGQTEARYFLVKKTSPTTSTLTDLPAALRQYTSEYHYLFSVIRSFVESPNKDDVGQLLALPNALRRFVELYTYMRLPLPHSTVEQRTAELLGPEKALRITKLLHHFSHLETVERLATHTNVIADIEAVVAEVMNLLQEDPAHLAALMGAHPEAA